MTSLTIQYNTNKNLYSAVIHFFKNKSEALFGPLVLSLVCW